MTQDAERLHNLLARFRKLQVIAPHPDDEVFGAAGLIQQAAMQGLQVTIHIATDGEKCFGTLPTPEETALRSVRRQESIAASHVLGYAEPQFWDCGDGALSLKQSCLRTRIQQNDTLDTLWLGPWQEDGHPDHNAVGQVLAALQVPALYYLVWGRLDGAPRLEGLMSSAYPMTFGLSPMQWARKHRASQCFKSQFDGNPFQQRAIITPQHLRHFIAEHEVYCYGH